MSEKILQGRIMQKHGTAAEWALATTFIPKDGELIVYDVDNDNPSPRFKVGNGVDKVNDLPFSDDDIRAAIAELPTKDYVDSGDEVPFFDLVEMGLPAVLFNDSVYAETDVTTICTALGNTTIKVLVNLSYNEMILPINLILTPAKSDNLGQYQASSQLEFASDIWQFVIIATPASNSLRATLTSMVTTRDLSEHDTDTAAHLNIRVAIANTINELFTDHNTSHSAHSDIRAAIPTSVSQLANDSGYLTEHQSLDGYATETYVQNLLETALVEGAW